MTKTQQIWQH